MSSNLAELSNSLLSVLECPVCLAYMVRPIRQCQNGHNICSECINKVRNCPTCRNAFIDTRNYPLEEIASKMEFPCDFKSQGCTVALKYDDLQKHKKVCSYGNRRCAVRLCKWKGASAMFMDHVKNAHPTKLLQKHAGYHHHTASLQWPWLTSKLNGWLVFLLKDLGELFWVHVKQEAMNGKVMVSVQHVTSESTDKFLYEVKLNGLEASSVYRAPTVSDTVQMNSVFVEEGCFCITVRALKHFVVLGNVLLEMKVEKL